eukprot:m.292994 g.292994  ORF g.292994 m.292994 type:complete len:323 (+) comp17907_c0_seq1:3-971(+)
MAVVRHPQVLRQLLRQQSHLNFAAGATLSQRTASLQHTPAGELAEIEEVSNTFISSDNHDGAKMSVVANGLGSVLHVQFPARAALHARSDAILAHSDKVKITSTMFGNPFAALARRMGGGPLLLNTIKTSEHTGDALLTPPHFGDLAVLELDGSQAYCVRPSSLLAYSPTLSAGASMKLSSLSMGIGTMFVKGRGDMAVVAPGGIFRLELQEGEKYHVAKRNVIAWQATMAPEVSTNEAEEVLPWYTRLWNKLKPSGPKDLCLLYGPGDFYLSSRSSDTNNWLSSAVSATKSATERVITITKTPTRHSDTVIQDALKIEKQS